MRASEARAVAKDAAVHREDVRNTLSLIEQAAKDGMFNIIRPVDRDVAAYLRIIGYTVTDIHTSFGDCLISWENVAQA